jgi:hypothetical protein
VTPVTLLAVTVMLALSSAAIEGVTGGVNHAQGRNGTMPRAVRAVVARHRGGTPETARSVTIATAAAALLIAAGWWIRDDLPLSPRDGLGYALGVAGLGAMCTLLIYSARKRMRLAASWGAIRSWFRFHMLLGIAGPVAILYHAGFRMGSPNSAVAMACVLLVSGSGLVGRVLYTRVHSGLSGHRLTLDDLRHELASDRGGIERLAPALGQRLAALDALIPHEPPGVFTATVGAVRVARSVTRTRTQCEAWLRDARVPSGGRAGALVLSPETARQIRSQLDDYLGAVGRSARFALYERFFSLWHALHLPLCFLLFTCAAIHVIAVHLY